LAFEGEEQRKNASFKGGRRARGMGTCQNAIHRKDITACEHITTTTTIREEKDSKRLEKCRGWKGANRVWGAGESLAGN